MLEDPLLDVLQAVVVLVEDAGRLVHVQAVFGGDPPGDFQHGVDVRPHPALLWALLAHPFELGHLPLQRRTYGVGQVTAGDHRTVVLGGPVI